MVSKTLLLALGLQMCFAIAHAENDYSEFYAYTDANQQSTFMKTDFSRTVNSALDVNFVNPWHLTLEIDRRAERFMRLSGAGFPKPKGADSNAWDQKYRQAQEQAKANVLSEIASRGQAAAAERARFNGVKPSTPGAYPRTRVALIGFASDPDMDQKIYSGDYIRNIQPFLRMEEELDSKTANLEKLRSLMLFEGGRKDLAEFFDALTYNHSVGKEIRATIGISFNPATPLKESGFRASLALLKFLAMNPETIGYLESQSVHFRVYDAETRKSYVSLKEFYGSDTWKNINHQMSLIAKEVAQPEFQEKVKLANEMDKKMSRLNGGPEWDQLRSQSYPLRKEVAMKSAVASSQKIVSDAILKLAATGETATFPMTKELSSMINQKIAAEIEARLNKESGRTIDPVEAARAAAREAK